MIVRARDKINLLNQKVYVNGSRDDRFYCTGISLGSYSGLTTADFDVPELAFDEFDGALRDAHVRVSLDGSGTDHFSGYLAVDTGVLDPGADSVKVKAYTRTKWLDKVHVGQFEVVPKWEVKYWVVNPYTGLLTGWTPATILQDMFMKLPEEDQERIGLGDIRALHDIASLSAPDIAFRLVTYRQAINQIMDLLGDVAFRERFEGDRVLLDFYRVSEAVSARSRIKCAQWDSPSQSRANVQAISKFDDGTMATNRVRGYGAYRQFMITCRNSVAGLEGISETNPFCQLIPDWDDTLESLVLKAPELAYGEGEAYSASAVEEVAADATNFKVTVDMGEIPVGSTIGVESSGEVLKVTGFTPAVEAVEADPEADPPVEAVEAQDAVVTVTRAHKDTEAAVIEAGDTLNIMVPGIQYVFRRYRLPAVLNGYTIMRQGCVLDAQGENYPQYQAFVYEAKEVKRIEGPTGKLWREGIIPGLLEAQQVDQVEFDVERRRVTFARPTVTLDEAWPKDDGSGDLDTTYQKTVCGVTFTVENRDYPFAYDTGAVGGVVGYDFAENAGLMEQWQSNNFQFWCIGTAGLPIRGVEFPCLRFTVKQEIDELSGLPVESEGDAHWADAGSGIVVRNDLALLKAQCEQILREKCRRMRSWQVTIPWFDEGYRVGQAVMVEGVRDVPRDNYKITSVSYDLPRNGAHKTQLVIDNVKPPVRNTVAAL